MSYQQQFQQPTSGASESQLQQQQPQQSNSGHETPANDSPAPGFGAQQQNTGDSQHGSDGLGEKTTLWYVKRDLRSRK